MARPSLDEPRIAAARRPLNGASDPAGAGLACSDASRAEDKMLTEAQVVRYRRDGYLFPFPALSPAELAEGNDGFARFEDWLGKPVNQGDFRWRSAGDVFPP